jgi:hypothetical protein
METTIVSRKQTLKNGLITFALNTASENSLFSVSTDINKGYWIYKGVIYDNTIFNIKAAKKVKTTQLSKDTVYYISTADERLRSLCNLDKN